MFIVAPFTIAKLWNQPRCPSTDERIKNMWQIYTREYYSGEWVELQIIMLRKINQIEKDKYPMFSGGI
jgi:hypothetical protein